MKRARFVFVVASARLFAPPAPPVMQAVEPTGLQPAWQTGMRPALQSAAHPTHELRNAPSRNTVPLAPLAMLAIIGTAISLASVLPGIAVANEPSEKEEKE